MAYFEEEPRIQPPLLAFLVEVRQRLVVIGSYARGERWPKDLDFLWDIDSGKARKEIEAAIRKYNLRFESMCPGNWTFVSYGWQVEILPIHRGPKFKNVIQSATIQTINAINGVDFRVARPEYAK